jgi:ATP-dependent Clp protease ATP-binding subunit ClpB
LGSEHIQPDLPDEVVEERVLKAVRTHFRPEFLNRVDDLIVFHRLSMEELRQIVDIQLGQLRARLAARQISLEVTDAAKDLLAREGFDPVYGARPLKRVIQKELADPLAMKLLAGEFSDGDTIKVDESGGELSMASGILRA